MKPRTFFRYAFTARAIAWWAVITVFNALAWWGCTELLTTWPYGVYLKAGLAVKYSIFCSSYLIVSFVRWKSYVRFHPSTR